MTHVPLFAAALNAPGDGRFEFLLVVAASLLAAIAVVALGWRGLRRLAATTTREFNERLRDEVASWAAHRLGGNLDSAQEQFERAFRLNDWAELTAPWNAVKDVGYSISRDGSNIVRCEVNLIAMIPDSSKPVEASFRFELPWSDLPEQLRRALLREKPPFRFDLLAAPDQPDFVSSFVPTS